MYIVKSLVPPSFYCRQQVKSLVPSTMMMGLWFILLVPFIILMVVVGNRRRKEEEDEEVGSGTYHGEEEEEEEGEEERESQRKPKRTPHPCGNMSQGRQELKGVEPPNLFAPIVTRNTQVHIPV